MLKLTSFKSLPSTYGVYIFKKDNQILYIGKANNIKVRVKSHFKNADLDQKEKLIITQSNNIEFIVTQNEFNALLKESELIKKYQPKYNLICKDNKSYLYIKITIKEEFPKVLICRKENDGQSLYFGPLSSAKLTNKIVNDLRRIIPFCTQAKISSRPCFYSKIKLCDPCPNYMSQINDRDEYNLIKKKYIKQIKQIINILSGKSNQIIKSLYNQLKKLIKEKEYEKAIVVRNKVFRLNRVLQNSFADEYSSVNLISWADSLKKLIQPFFPQIKTLFRIEGYDISNIGMSNQVASMVVYQQGIVDKKQYKRFKIKDDKNRLSDFDRIKEVITRRFNNDWLYPDLLIIDGGLPQVEIVLSTLNHLNINIPVIGIAKNPDRLIIKTDRLHQIEPSINDLGFNLIKLIRDEAHRFAKKYHLFLRERDFLI